MVTKVCFVALSNHKIVRKIVPIEHNFEVIPGEEFLGYKLSETSIESQVIDYLDVIDKSDIMLKYDFDMIIDYYIPKKKKKKSDELAEFIEYLRPYITEDMYRPIEAIISEAKDILFGKGKSNETKAKELFIIYGIVNKSIKGTLNSIEKIIENYENSNNRNTRRLRS
jgi:hypothetical protein|nr:MAG TPA: hypothetical protein [Bacteriophage sp.]